MHPVIYNFKYIMTGGIHDQTWFISKNYPKLNPNWIINEFEVNWRWMLSSWASTYSGIDKWKISMTTVCGHSYA